MAGRSAADISRANVPGMRRKTVAPPPAAAPGKAPKTILVGAGSIVSVLILVLLLAGWGAGMTFMLLFGDRLSGRLMAEHSEMQDRYEQTLEAHRAEIRRLVSEMEESKLGQSDVGQALTNIVQRQRALEVRLQALQRLNDLVGPGGAPGGVPTLSPSPAGAPPPSAPLPPSRTTRGALDGPVDPFAPPSVPKRRSALDGAPEPHAGGLPIVPVQAADDPPSEVDEAVERLSLRLQLIERQQDLVIDRMVKRSFDRIDSMRLALREIGMTPEQVSPGKRSDPYVPNVILPLSDQNGPFGRKVGQIRTNFLMSYRMRHAVDALPTFNPAPTLLRYSSPFGYRKHPVLGTQRLHAGLDLAAPTGTTIRAAGSGVVLSAGWGGGYGNLIQIDHGNGVVTRYAHLSQIDVTAGQPVAAGMVVGRMGSTGLSTGSHLHFETRIYGTPNNPACFLHAGEKLRTQPPVPFACDKRPVWQKGQEEEEDADE